MASDKKDNGSADSLSIKRLLQKVRQELIESQKETEKSGQKALFVVDRLDLEINFVVTKTTEAQGGFAIQVLTLGGRRAHEHQETHRITLSLRANTGDEAPAKNEDSIQLISRGDSSNTGTDTPGLKPAEALIEQILENLEGSGRPPTEGIGKLLEQYGQTSYNAGYHRGVTGGGFGLSF